MFGQLYVKKGQWSVDPQLVWHEFSLQFPLKEEANSIKTKQLKFDDHFWLPMAQHNFPDVRLVDIRVKVVAMALTVWLVATYTEISFLVTFFRLIMMGLREINFDELVYKFKMIDLLPQQISFSRLDKRTSIFHNGQEGSSAQFKASQANLLVKKEQQIVDM